MIEILYAYNGGYESIVATSIVSVCKNHNEGEIRFHAIVQNAKSSEKKKIQEIVESYGNKIVFYECGNMEKYFGKEINTHAWPRITLARLLLSKYLPKDLERVIYIDGDTMIRGSLSELYEMDLGKNIVAMSLEPIINPYAFRDINELKNNPYCNSGVILIDLAKWRDEKISSQFISFLKARGTSLFIVDQDAINIVLQDKIFFLPPKYNYSCYYDEYPYRVFKSKFKSRKYSSLISKEVYDDSSSNPVIVHFLGPNKPWEQGSTHRFMNEYAKYQKLIPWVYPSKHTSKKTFYYLRKIFYFVLSPFPSVRLHLVLFFSRPAIYSALHKTKKD